MLSNYALWFWAYGVIGNLLGVLSIIFICIGLIGILWVPFACDYDGNKSFWKSTPSKFKRLLIGGLILFTLLINFPSKKDIITYLSLKEVDKYNEQSVDSNLQPYKVIENVDETVSMFLEILDSTTKELEGEN